MPANCCAAMVCGCFTIIYKSVHNQRKPCKYRLFPLPPDNSDSKGRWFDSSRAYHMNETRFSNNFFEKRVSSFRKALQHQGFPILCFWADISKLQKRKSIIFAP